MKIDGREIDSISATELRSLIGAVPAEAENYRFAGGSLLLPNDTTGLWYRVKITGGLGSETVEISASGPNQASAVYESFGYGHFVATISITTPMTAEETPDTVQVWAQLQGGGVAELVESKNWADFPPNEIEFSLANLIAGTYDVTIRTVNAYGVTISAVEVLSNEGSL